MNPLAYFMTLFWTFLLTHMMAYVVSSMNGVPYEFMTANIIAVVVTVLLFVIGTVIPKPEPAEHH
ncbi:YjzD family protein [Jeotgalibacillus terrae]|uniref:YjzD family protein n=1 Tax=Jeotgalibacillus terrae TaxID=587735 RepID=A0ABW5ZEQ9_9BACL